MAYGVDGNSSRPVACVRGDFDNFSNGWALRVAQSLGAALSVQAISGIGVTRNAVCGHGPTLPELLGRSLHTVDRDDYDPRSWL